MSVWARIYTERDKKERGKNNATAIRKRKIKHSVCLLVKFMIRNEKIVAPNLTDGERYLTGS